MRRRDALVKNTLTCYKYPPFQPLGVITARGPQRLSVPVPEPDRENRYEPTRKEDASRLSKP